MKYLLLVLCLVLCGCNNPDSVGTARSGQEVYTKVCIDDVEYLIRIGGYQGYMAPHFKPDGSLYICNN